MFIKPESIDNLLEHANIIDVVKHYLPDLKGRRKTITCSCPLPNHTENTPSFTVTETLGIFKCFGCGKGGNSVKFVMEYEGLAWIEAVKRVAEITNFTLDYDKELTEAQQQVREQKMKARASMQALLNFALAFYQAQEIPEQWYLSRGFKLDILKNMAVGFALKGWNNLLNAALKKGFSLSQLIAAGLVEKKEGKDGKIKMYDTFRQRVMFPIFNERGHILHFSGRTIQKAKTTPKYINGTDTELYKKSNSLYGFSPDYTVVQAIREAGFVYFVEGAPNVLRLHQEGRFNVLAALGTGLTDAQIKLIKRYTNRIVYIPDHDHKVNKKTKKVSNPGFEAFERNARLFIAAGFTVRFLTTKQGTDVDEYLKVWSGEQQSKKQWFDSAQDFISDYKVGFAISMGDDPSKRAELIKELWEIVDSIPDNVVKTSYHTNICKELKEFGKVKKLVLDDHEQLNKKLKNIDRSRYDDFVQDGFSTQNGCYVTFKGDKEVELTNFTMEMLFFVRSSIAPKWIVKMTNQFGYSVVIPVDARDLTNVGKFEEVLSAYSNFLFFGNKTDLNRVKRKLFFGVKKAFQPSYLGWSNLGFWIWANGIYHKGSFYKADEYGIVELLREVKSLAAFKGLHKETNIRIQEQDHVLDDAQKILEEMNEDAFTQLIKAGQVKEYQYVYLPYSQKLDNQIGDEDDDFADIRKFRFYEDSDLLTFNEWAKQMVLVYHKNAPFMIANVIVSVFKDIVFKENNNWFPIEFHFGEKQSGKSQAMESEASIFGHVKPGGINIHSGGSTPTGIQRIISNFQNSVIVLNEYKNSIHDSKIEMLKSFADGSGKLTAKKTMGLETASLKTRAVPIVGGQDLPTKEAALLSRCNILRWTTDHRNPKAFKTLKKWESQGRCTWVVNQLMEYRKLFKQHYKTTRDKMVKLYEQEFENSNKAAPSDRETLNKTTLIAAVKILQEHTDLDFGFDFNEFFVSCMENSLTLVDIQQTSDEIETFLSVVFSITDVEGHISTKPVKLGEHIMVKKDGDFECLYLRLRSVYQYYKEASTRRGDTPMAESGIKSYLMNHRYFLEKKKNIRFDNIDNPTSCMILDYKMMQEDDLFIAMPVKQEKEL